ncbi:MAG: hypothetical protein QM718_09035 [Steroidobacteraceae bacterium]
MPRISTPRLVRLLNESDPVMAQLAAAAGPCTSKPAHQAPPFESLARAIAHQQLNGKVAAKIVERFIQLHHPGVFPTPEQLQLSSDSALRAVGFSFAKIAALRDLAARTLDGTVPDSATLQQLTDAEIIERLTAVRGIGRWTVEMLLMFQLGRPDVLPVDDFGVRNGFRLAYGLRNMPTPKALAAFGVRWAGARSLAAWYLWRAVDLHREGRLPAPPKPAPRVAQSRPAASKRLGKAAAKRPAAHK